jgi:cytoskeletal protein RodZ
MKMKIPHKFGFTKTTAALVLAAALAISLVVGFTFFRSHQPNISANAVQTSTTTTSPATQSSLQTTPSTSTTTAAASGSSTTTTSVNTSVDQTCQVG